MKPYTSLPTILLAISFLLACVLLKAQSPTVINAADFGLQTGSYLNASGAISNALEACRGKDHPMLVLPGGRIDLWPEDAPKRPLYISNCTENDSLSKVKNIAFLLDDYHNLTIEGNNTLVVLHGKMVSFALLHCSNIRIRNIRFDYERPTMSEMTVQSVSANGVEVQVHPDSRFSVDSGRVSFYGEGWKTNAYHTILLDTAKNTMHYSSLQPLLKARCSQLSANTLRFGYDLAKALYKPGDVLTFRDPYRDNCGGFISRSSNIELYNVQMHYMHGLGIVSQFSENITMRKVRVAPRENSGRVIASFADCFHFSGCRGKLLIDSCFTSGSHDDPVNVHGTHLQVVASAPKGKMRVRFMHHQTYGFEAFTAGDSIAFIDPKTLLPLGTARLKAAKLINLREMEIELPGDLPPFVKEGLCIENITWTPEVTIRNSRFERTNTRGLLVTTRRKVLIENNHFYHTGMFPILIANDASGWFESGPVQDVLIRNNVFEGCGYNSGSGAINIAPENHVIVPGRFVHRNIRITGNTFIAPVKELLLARSVQGLEFTNNRVLLAYAGDDKMAPALIKLTACSNVKIIGNKVNQPFTPVIFVNNMQRSVLTTDWSAKNQKDTVK